ncbi:MAG: Bug family tripartite tricarboxylate transporter substrate binding protein [Burkholderiales bacterium]
MAVDEVEPEGPEEFDMLTVDILVHAWAANAHERAWPAGSRAAVPCTRVRGKALPSKALLQHAALWLLASPFVAFAQATYPAKPIRWIVPFPPGGSTTIIARLMGQKLTETWGQQVVVDNRGGGNTIIGSEAMVRSAPDGYTILQVTTTHVINPSLLATPYDAVKDFAPVGTLVATETLMVVTPSLPANNLQELIALAKAKPGQLNFGSSGSGTTNHLAMELFSIMAGIKMQHIPYKGAGPGVIDLIGGQIQIFTNNALPLTPFVKSGKIRAIAVSGETRLRSLPDVPTFTQGGLPGYDVKSWQGILAPARTPKPIIDKLSQEIARILQMPDVRENLLTMGADPFVSTPQQLAALIKVDLVRYAKLIKDANIKLE